MNKIEKATNDIIKNIKNVKNENMINEHMKQVSFRNEVILESHFDTLHNVMQESIKDDVMNKVKKTKYSPDKKGIIMQIIKKHDYDGYVVDILTALDKESMKKAVDGYKSVRGAQAFKNLINNMKSLGL